jgi:uncharacterized protein
MHHHRAKRFWISLCLIAFAVVFPAVAQGHVTVQPSEQPAGEFVRADVRVPNEQDSAGTNKVRVQFPPGFLFASYQPVPGWKGKITMEKLAKPVPSPEGGEPIKEQVKQVTFTASDKSAAIGPGQFQDFGLSLLMPDKAGTTLTFKAVQTYDNGDVSRWIGPPDSEEPAPQVKLTSGDSAETTPAAATTTSSSSSDDDDASKGLGIAALILGALGAILGAGALILSRRRALSSLRSTEARAGARASGPQFRAGCGAALRRARSPGSSARRVASRVPRGSRG